MLVDGAREGRSAGAGSLSLFAALRLGDEGLENLTAHGGYILWGQSAHVRRIDEPREKNALESWMLWAS